MSRPGETGTETEVPPTEMLMKGETDGLGLKNRTGVFPLLQTGFPKPLLDSHIR